MSSPLTMLDKLWSSHEIERNDAGKSLLWVDRHLVHEGSHHAFAKIDSRKLPVARPDLTFAVNDHYAPTSDDRFKIADASIMHMMQTLRSNAKKHGIQLFDLNDNRQGIVHVIGPELGITLPGLVLNCGDSHTSTHGAFGTLAFGIGATEVAHVLATQTLWQYKPRCMRIRFEGELSRGVTAKDLALHWISKLGNDAAQGYAIEYAGSAIDQLSMSARMTLCNLSIEGGARFGMIAPDQTTFQYLKNKPYSPKGALWEEAVKEWLTLASDNEARFDKDVLIDCSEVEPTVTWGTNPEQAIGITKSIPEPSKLTPDKAKAAESALDYMALRPGQKLIGTPIDQVFLGSCTNARIEDLREAANVLQGHKSLVPGLVSPGSTNVKAQAEREGLDAVFKKAGLRWGQSGCSSCVGMNGDIVQPGKRCASTTNRNFKGRQGPGSRTHLMSPSMVAAAAISGKIVDVRQLKQLGDC